MTRCPMRRPLPLPRYVLSQQPPNNSSCQQQRRSNTHGSVVCEMSDMIIILSYCVACRSFQPHDHKTAHSQHRFCVQAGDDLAPAPGQKHKKHKKLKDQAKEGQGSAGHLSAEAGMDDLSADELDACLSVPQPKPAGSSKRVSCMLTLFCHQAILQGDGWSAAA